MASTAKEVASPTKPTGERVENMLGKAYDATATIGTVKSGRLTYSRDTPVAGIHCAHHRKHHPGAAPPVWIQATGQKTKAYEYHQGSDQHRGAMRGTDAVAGFAIASNGETAASCDIAYSFTLPKEQQPRKGTETMSRSIVTTTTNGQTKTTMQPWPYTSGQTVDVWYDPSDYTNIGLASDHSRKMGGVLIVFALAGLALLWLQFWLTRRYKAYAALRGADSILDVVTGH